MKHTSTALAVVILLAGLILSACSTQVEIGMDGQINQADGSGSVDLDLGLSDGSQPEQEAGNNAAQGNQTLDLQSDGLLILVGLAILVFSGILIGASKPKGSLK